jgi:hypothetical protein
VLMVIFGAGASYDSAEAFPSDLVQPWRPPLANELFLDRDHQFGEIVRRYPKLIHFLPLLRRQPRGGKSVEELLELLQSESATYPERQCQFASVRYYIRDLFTEITERWYRQTNGVTNYAPLIDQILSTHKSNEPVCLVTFNYDLLLEHALQTFGFKTRSPEEQLNSHPIIKLFKLHGSVGWARVVDYPTDVSIRPTGLIEMAGSIKLSHRYVLADSSMTDMHGKLLFPAIAIPVQNKTAEYFECPRAHLDQLCELLASVNKILIIGWQAREAHFLKLLNSYLPRLDRIMVVSKDGESSLAILNHFRQEVGPKALDARCETTNGGFTDFILNQKGNKFFAV